MNCGQSQAKLSVAITAPFRQSAHTMGGQGLDKLSRPYGRLGIQWDGQDAFWGVVGGKSGALV